MSSVLFNDYLGDTEWFPRNRGKHSVVCVVVFLFQAPKVLRKYQGVSFLLVLVSRCYESVNAVMKIKNTADS